MYYKLTVKTRSDIDDEQLKHITTELYDNISSCIDCGPESGQIFAVLNIMDRMCKNEF